ncbi:hypothetical protein ACXR0O_14155 [Verrucomicrobiota bacterium sgz303538]
MSDTAIPSSANGTAGESTEGTPLLMDTISSATAGTVLSGDQTPPTIRESGASETDEHQNASPPVEASKAPEPEKDLNSVPIDAVSEPAATTPEGPLPAEELVRLYGSELVSEFSDAELLMSYLSRNGLPVTSPEVIQGVVQARERFRRGIFNCEKEEAHFRTLYGELARAAAPVTVASLRDSLPTPPRRIWFFFEESEPRSEAERCCVYYRNRAFAVLLILIISQVYWTICSNLLSQLPGFGERSAETTTVAAATQEPSTNSSGFDRDRILTIEKSRYETLKHWVNPFLRNTADEYSSGTTEKAPNTPKGATTGTIQPELDKAAATRQLLQHVNVCVVAEQVVSVIQAWWLPLLYGALGAMVFVVRTLSLQASSRLFRKDSLVSYNLRIYLGTIAGLAIGWFLKPDREQIGTIGALSPFALAFVAGYGVEIFFALLDKVVSSFTSGTKQQ